MTITRIETGLAAMPLPFAAPDLSDLGPEEAGWHVWPYGSLIAVVRRIHGRDPDRPRIDDYDYDGTPRLPNGQSYRDRFIAVLPMMYTHKLVWGFVVDALEGHEDGWCYHTALDAIAAGQAWKGLPGSEPEGWHRHPASKRRRRYDGELDPGQVAVASGDGWVEYMLEYEIGADR